MKVNTVITLENDLNVLLIDKAMYDNNDYFLAILLDENEEPTEESVILKEIVSVDGTYVEKEEDPNKLAELLKIFTKSLNMFIAKLPDTE